MRPILVSVSDTAGYITGVNAAFTAASGYSREEPLGQPHSILRHPEMPAAAFADLWATLGGGEIWQGVMKNRRKNGEHFWALTYAAPLRQAGRLAGYIAVRTTPAVPDIEGAEALHRALALGQSRWPSTLADGRRFRVKQVCLTAGMSSSTVALGAAAAWHGSGLGFVAAALLAGMGLTAWLELQLMRPLRAVRRQALIVAGGAVPEPEWVRSGHEIGMALRAVHLIGLHRQAAIDEVRLAADSMRKTGSPMLAQSDGLCQLVERSAAMLQQVAAAQAELAASLQQRAVLHRALAGWAQKESASPGHEPAGLREALSTLARWAHEVSGETAAVAAEAGAIERSLVTLDRSLQDQAEMAHELRTVLEPLVSLLALMANNLAGLAAPADAS